MSAQNDKIPLNEFFLRRTAAEKVYADELKELAKRVSSLIPDGLQKYLSSDGIFPTGIEAWLNDLYEYTSKGSYQHSTIKSAIGYGFENMKDAKKKLKLLKKAWKGLIDVEIGLDGSHTRVVFRLVLNGSMKLIICKGRISSLFFIDKKYI